MNFNVFAASALSASRRGKRVRTDGENIRILQLGLPETVSNPEERRVDKQKNATEML